VDGAMGRGMRGRHPQRRTWPHGRVFPRWSGAANNSEKERGKGEQRRGEVVANRPVPLVGYSRGKREAGRMGRMANGPTGFRVARCS
jgi:hypothetical protein